MCPKPSPNLLLCGTSSTGAWGGAGGGTGGAARLYNNTAEQEAGDLRLPCNSGRLEHPNVCFGGKAQKPELTIREHHWVPALLKTSFIFSHTVCTWLYAPRSTSSLSHPPVFFTLSYSYSTFPKTLLMESSMQKACEMQLKVLANFYSFRRKAQATIRFVCQALTAATSN